MFPVAFQRSAVNEAMYLDVMVAFVASVAYMPGCDLG